MTIHKINDVARQGGCNAARALRALADRAEQGEVLGIALAARTAARDTELLVLGMYEQVPEIAHYAVCKLRDVLLYPDDTT